MSSSTPSTGAPHAPGPHLISTKPIGKIAPPSPSSSIIVVSPTNKILLLHRLQKSSAFPSAHVFPGGNLEPSDGQVPADGKDRHIDNPAYRTGGIRELFEESGVLLAKEKGSDALLQVSDADRIRGRKAVHRHKLSFADWLKQQSATATLDTEGLIPFTHWITPPNVPKRYTTQMYLYFVPVSEDGNESVSAVADEVETMAAEWDTASNWTRRAREGSVILFPPQYLLLELAGGFLDRREGDVLSRREKLREFITNDGTPTWDKKFISPLGLSFGRRDGRAVLALDKPGPELMGTGLTGDDQRVVLVKFMKEGPRNVEVRWRKDVMEEERAEREASGGKATERGKDMADMAREKAAKEKESKL
jgi:hypothetical protein